jgi:NADH-quinone oxidoreductase subunit C
MDRRASSSYRRLGESRFPCGVHSGYRHLRPWKVLDRPDGALVFHFMHGSFHAHHVSFHLLNAMTQQFSAKTKIAANIASTFPSCRVDGFRGQTRLAVPVASLFDVLKMLKESRGFDLLVDITCVDYLNYSPEDHPGKNGTENPGRFGLVYLLASTESNERLTVRCFVKDSEPAVPSVVSLWEGANWLEREVWDMFGVRFQNHPDLRRILLPEEFASHPLRKDYPLQGCGERHNFSRVKRGEE